MVLDSWSFLQRSGRLTLYGYVILENHLHFIASAADLVKEVKDFKSFTARRVLDFLHDRGETRLLERLEWLKQRTKTESRYQVWQEGNHPQQIVGDDMMHQKLEYIHNNPVARGYVDVPWHWRYSTRNYEGMPGLIEVTTNWQ